MATSGTVSAGGNLTLQGRIISLAGDVSGETVTLQATEQLSQMGGIISAGTLTGSADSAALIDGNRITTLGSFTFGGNFTLFNTVSLTQTAASSVLGAGRILIDNGGAVFTQGGTLSAGGATQPAVTIQNTAALSVGTITAPNGGVALGSTGKAVGTVTEAGSITAASLAGNTTGNVTLDGNNAISNLGALSIGNANLVLNDAIGLNITGPVSVGTGSVRLTVAGLIAEQSGGSIAAGSLASLSSGGANFSGQNRIGTLAASTNTGGGGFSLNNVSALTVGGAVNAGSGDLALTVGALTVNAGLSAGSNILATSTGAVAINGLLTFNAGKNLVMSSNGAFTQRGTLNVASPDFVVDATGHPGGASQLLSDLLAAQGGGSSIANAALIKNGRFEPKGTVNNPISFDNGTVNAADSVMLLFGDTSALSGTVNVKGLGISGLGGSADLHGSIAGNSSQTAGQQGFINPRPDNNYKFNDCAIGSTSCIVFSTVVPIQPQAASQIDILLARPSEDDIDAPLINIFDEEQLCERLRRTNPEAAQQVCR
jgi:hypothetical protein